jgi:cyanophycinase
LLIVGGGTNSRPVIEAAQRWSGGQSAHWVVIPTAQDDRQREYPEVPALIRQGGNFTILHTRDRTVAESEAFVAPLLRATAVWFDGGRQWRLADTYGETRTEERALHALLARDGLIAGSSAGATIMGRIVRGDPSGNESLMSPGHERGFGFLKNVAIDQHIAARRREADLARVVAAFRASSE